MKTAILLMVISLISCSKQNSNQSSNLQENQEIERSFDASESSVTSPSGTEVDEIIQVSFGTILNTEQRLLSATIRNNSTDKERISSVTRVSSEDNHFVQISNNCNNIAPKSTCSLKMSFNARVAPQNQGGLFSGQWVINFSDNTSKTVQMNIQVNVPVPPSAEDLANQQALLLSNLSLTPSSVDFGEISDKESKTMSIVIKNNNSSPVTDVSSVQGPYSLVSSCSTIRAKGSCTARVSLSGSGKSGSQSGTFLFGSREVPLSGEVLTQQQIIDQTPLVLNISSSSEFLDFGSLSSTAVSRNVSFVNNSNVPVTLPTILSNNDFTITSNSCNNSQIGVKSSCSVRLSLNPLGKSAGELTGSLSFGNISVSLLADIQSSSVTPPPAPVACSLLNASSHGVTVDGVTSEWQCS